MDCSTPGLPVVHYLLEFALTHVCYNWTITFSVQDSPFFMLLCSSSFVLWRASLFSYPPFPHKNFILLTGTFLLAYKYALASPGLEKPSLDSTSSSNLCSIFSACLHSRTFWNSCLYWLSPLPYLSLTLFWLPSRKPSLHWNSFTQGHQWPPCCWILWLFLILLRLL